MMNFAILLKEQHWWVIVWREKYNRWEIASGAHDTEADAYATLP